MRKSSFSHFDSTLLHIPTQHSFGKHSPFTFPLRIAIFIFLGQGKKGKGAALISALISETRPHLREIETHPPPYHIPLVPCKESAAPHCCALLEECFPCVLQNIFYVHSPCPSFAIYMICPDNPTPLDVVTHKMDNLDNDRDLGNLMNMKTETSEIRMIGTRT